LRDSSHELETSSSKDLCDGTGSGLHGNCHELLRELLGGSVYVWAKDDQIVTLLLTISQSAYTYWP